MKRIQTACLLLILNFIPLLTLKAQELEKDTLFRKYDILPAISYSPETELTLGVIGYRYLQLGSQANTTRSFINFLAIYTTKQQTIIEANWDIFLEENKYRFRGSVGYNQFPDRNYGIGNEAIAQVREFDIDNGNIGSIEEVNYLRYDIDRFFIKPVALKQVADNLFTGFSLDIESQYNYQIIPDSVALVEGGESIRLLESNITGLRSGIGLNLIWDERDNIINPRKGHYVELSNTYYTNLLGSDYDYVNLRIDARKYWNPIKNHTLAIRGNTYFTFAESGEVPIRGLSRVGGNDLVRGYFRGTYQDRNLVSFQSEYRLPFWKDDVDAPLYKFWKRLGVVAFAGGAQVFGDEESFDISQFNYSVGAGLRILFNPETKLNLRIDYGLGLSPDANGQDGRQSGVYFFLSEAF